MIYNFPISRAFPDDSYFAGDRITLLFETPMDYPVQFFDYSVIRLKCFYNGLICKGVSSSPILKHLTVKHKVAANKFQYIVSILFSCTICTRIRKKLTVLKIKPLVYEKKDFVTILTYSLMVLKDLYGINKDNYWSSDSIAFWKSLCTNDSHLYTETSLDCFLHGLLTPHIRSKERVRLVIKEILEFTKKSKD